jgi:hypothetical protein
VLLCPMVLAVLISGGSGVQAVHPDFTGHWVLASRPAGEIPAICRLECVITQDQKTLVVKEPNGDLIESFPLDGLPRTERRQQFGYSTEVTTTAAWDGSALLITRTTASRPTDDPQSARARVESRNRVVLEGGQLVFERTRTSSAPLRGSGAAPVRIVYARKR